MIVSIAALAIAIWLYLLFARGAFWVAAERDVGTFPLPATWPRVTAVIPARDEAESIGETITSLLRQDYPGEWSIILVDDNSSDGTAEIARRAAEALGAQARLKIVTGSPLPTDWTGKLWAVKQGVEASQSSETAPDYLLLTDADIVYGAGVVSNLIAHAEAGRLVLTSLMVELRCESFAERVLIPAFVFFFQMLYPFAWVNRTKYATAAAAGGCMLAHAGTLRAAGGIEVIRNALIDDCALARIMKARGPIWLGLTERVHSIRSYPRIGDIQRMVARSAYAQLRYSPWLLAGTVVGMTLTYLVPVLMALFGDPLIRALGLWAWTLMAVAFAPTLQFYRRSLLWGFALPLIALCYLAFTLDSALQYSRGQGGLWKGRVQAAQLPGPAAPADPKGPPGAP
jgi:hopene-associated glycosyltransferase HpnB